MDGTFDSRWNFALRRCAWPCALLLVLLTATGCVQRRMTIRSNPPGALVYVDDYEIGTTPCSTDFIYYGTRKIRLVKDGYETLTVYQPVKTPWYQWWGVDFFSENIWPGEIRDERSFEFAMQPAVVVPTEQLLGRAENLRSSSRILPATATQPVIEAQPPVTPALPAETLPPPNTLPPSTLPPPTTLPPGNNYLPPPSSFPSGQPTPAEFPPAGSAPVYAPPGGAPLIAPPPIAPPNTGPTLPPPSSGPAMPPGWRPVGAMPNNPWR